LGIASQIRKPASNQQTSSPTPTDYTTPSWEGTAPFQELPRPSVALGVEPATAVINIYLTYVSRITIKNK